jgi:hypothetical protein
MATYLVKTSSEHFVVKGDSFRINDALFILKGDRVVFAASKWETIILDEEDDDDVEDEMEKELKQFLDHLRDFKGKISGINNIEE